MSILDRTLLAGGGTLLLGRAELSLETPPNVDVEAWYPLSAGAASAATSVGRPAGSIKLRQRFVPESHWAEYLRTAGTEILQGGMEVATAGSTPEGVVAGRSEPVVENDVCGLYLLVLGGAGCAINVVPPGTTARVVLSCGECRHETAEIPLEADLVFPRAGCEVFWGRVGARQDIRVELVFGSGEIEERAAAAVLRLERLPFDEVSLGPPVTNVKEILAPCTVVLVGAVVLLWLGIIYEINHGRCTKMHFLWSLAQKHRWA